MMVRPRGILEFGRIRRK